jgi:ERCC4-type nuclease
MHFAIVMGTSTLLAFRRQQSRLHHFQTNRISMSLKWGDIEDRQNQSKQKAKELKEFLRNQFEESKKRYGIFNQETKGKGPGARVI